MMTNLLKMTSKGKPCIVHAAAELDKLGVYHYTTPDKLGRIVLIKVGHRARFKTNTASGVCLVLAIDNTATYPLKLEYDVAGVGKRIEVFNPSELIEWLPFY